MRTKKQAAQARARKMEKKAAKAKARRAKMKEDKKQPTTCIPRNCEDFYRINPLTGQRYCNECNICIDCLAKLEEKAHTAVIDQIAKIPPGGVLPLQDVTDVLDELDVPPCVVRDTVEIITDEQVPTCISGAMTELGVRYVSNGNTGFLEQVRKPYSFS